MNRHPVDEVIQHAKDLKSHWERMDNPSEESCRMAVRSADILYQEILSVAQVECGALALNSAKDVKKLEGLRRVFEPLFTIALDVRDEAMRALHEHNQRKLYRTKI